MAITFANAVALLKHRIWRMFRTRQLRNNYVTHLRESASSLDERVRFHFDHIEVYWDRCLGFLPEYQGNTASLLSSDLGACVIVATEFASLDVHAYCFRYAANRCKIPGIAMCPAWPD